MTDAATSQHPICPVCETRHAPLSSGIHLRAEARRGLVAVTVDPDDTRPAWLRRATDRPVTPRS